MISSSPSELTTSYITSNVDWILLYQLKSDFKTDQKHNQRIRETIRETQNQRITESQNGAGRDLWRSHVQTPKQFAQDHIQAGFEYLQRRRSTTSLGDSTTSLLYILSLGLCLRQISNLRCSSAFGYMTLMWELKPGREDKMWALLFQKCSAEQPNRGERTLLKQLWDAM